MNKILGYILSAVAFCCLFTLLVTLYIANRYWPQDDQ